MTNDHLQAAHDAEVRVPDAVDAAVFADPTFKAARTRFAHAIERLAAVAPTSEIRTAVLDVEAAAHALVAASIDVAWRVGRSARPGPTSLAPRASYSSPRSHR